MSMAIPRQYIIVAAPSATAGIGNALRRAYNGPVRTPVQMFERLMQQLDRLD